MNADPKALRELAWCDAKRGPIRDALLEYAQLVERLQGGATEEMTIRWNDSVTARVAINAAFRAVLNDDAARKAGGQHE